MPIWIHFVYITVWISSSFVFAWSSFEAYQTKSITLPRYQHQLKNTPSNMSMKIGGVSFQEVITVANGIADTHNKNVDVLEQSIRQSALLSFRLNLMSCAAAILGLIAQLGSYHYDHRCTKAKKGKSTNHDSCNGVDKIKIQKTEKTKNTTDAP